MDPSEDKVVQVRHVYQDAGLSSVVNFGDPLLVLLTPRDTVGTLRARLQARLKMADAEMAKLRVGLVTFSRIEALGESARGRSGHPAARAAPRDPLCSGGARARQNAGARRSRAPPLPRAPPRASRRAAELVKARFRAQDNQQSGSWEDYIGIEHPAAQSGPGARRRHVTRYHDKPVRIYG